MKGTNQTAYVRTGGKWYFYDETGCHVGPYATLEAAQEALAKYALELDRELTQREAQARDAEQDPNR